MTQKIASFMNRCNSYTEADYFEEKYHALFTHSLLIDNGVFKFPIASRFDKFCLDKSKTIVNHYEHTKTLEIMNTYLTHEFIHSLTLDMMYFNDIVIDSHDIIHYYVNNIKIIFYGYAITPSILRRINWLDKYFNMNSNDNITFTFVFNDCVFTNAEFFGSWISSINICFPLNLQFINVKIHESIVLDNCDCVVNMKINKYLPSSEIDLKLIESSINEAKINDSIHVIIDKTIIETLFLNCYESHIENSFINIKKNYHNIHAVFINYIFSSKYSYSIDDVKAILKHTRDFYEKRIYKISFKCSHGTHINTLPSPCITTKYCSDCSRRNILHYNYNELYQLSSSLYALFVQHNQYYSRLMNIDY
jgi:hypothetical protein